MRSARRTARLVLFGMGLVWVIPAGAAEIAAPLEQRLVAAGPDDFVPAVVLMEEFPGREALLDEVRGLNRFDRRERTVSRLKSLAERTQRSIRAALEDAGDDVRDVRVLWGINGVAFEAKRWVIESVATTPGVRRVLHDGAGGRPAAGRPALTGPTGGDVSGPNPEADVAPELIAMGAKRVWDELGYTGAGVIVAVIDTGVDPTHPDLADHIWTNLDELADNGIDDDANGYVDDTWGWDFCGHDNMPDTGSHGTASAGQVAGDGTGGIVTGMAPDAELMVLGISCGSPDSIAWESSDYAIENGADIITMSFVWQWLFRPDQEAFRRQSDAELAAGVIRANAAGNDAGNPDMPVPYNVSAPANSPPPWLHPDQTLVGGVSSTLAVGNISWNTDLIASSSSRGPSAWEDIQVHTDPDYPYPMPPEYQDYPYENGVQMGLLKPDVAAYGNGTISTCPGPNYCTFAGTSAATPHVAGTLALMLSANPEATPAELTEAILTTAEHRGDAGKNNVYGAGLVQAFAATFAVEPGVAYESHAFDDTEGGNGDLALDPGERVILPLTVRSLVPDDAVDDLEAILTTTTTGVTIHDQHATYPSVPAMGSATSHAPHYSFTVDPDACTTLITFDLELRFTGHVRRSTFQVRVGDETPLTLLADDFETDTGWTSDPGTASAGSWDRGDPQGVYDGQGRPTNPEDDSSDPGTICWVTDNGGGVDENEHDVDDGSVLLISPPFGSLQMLSLGLTYDRWYYDLSFPSTDSFRTELSGDGGETWTLVEELILGFGGWVTREVDLQAVMPPTDDMRLRFVVSDDPNDSPVEGGVDEVTVEGTWVDCQDHVPTPASAPNGVGNSVSVGVTSGGHAAVTWTAPAVDAGHDAATLYRIERASSADGTFVEVGSATGTEWLDIDALAAPDSYFYRVRAENNGGTE